MIPDPPAVGGAIRVLLVDDQLLVADALARALSRQADIDVVGIAENVQQARDAMHQPVDVVLLDYLLPDGTGADAAKAIKAAQPAAKIVMLTGVEDDEAILLSVQAGADGYLTKHRPVADVVRAVRAAHAGETLLPRAVVVAIARRLAAMHEPGVLAREIEDLTPRETKLLQALADGRSVEERCELLGVGPNTVRTLTRELMAKLHARSELEAVAVALHHRLVEPPPADAGP